MADPVDPSDRLERVSYLSDATGKERDYFVYLPRGFEDRDDWPVILFLHGNGERGDGKGELDWVLSHGPLYEAWIQQRELPFVVIAPQLPMFNQGEIDYIKNRDPARIPSRQVDGTPSRPQRMRTNSPMNGQLAETSPLPPTGMVEGWSLLENELLTMVDHVLTKYQGDPSRVYLTGLSYGGFGTWYLAANHPDRFAAIAPVVGHGHVAHALPLATARMPIWQFAGGRDGAVPPRAFYAVLNRIEQLGHRDFRFTIEADMGHDAWVRAYQSADLYSWLLQHSLKNR